MMAGIVHYDNGVLWFDDIPVRTTEDIPRRAGMGGTVWYATAAVKFQDLIKVMGPDDSAFGPSPDTPIGASFTWDQDGKTKTLKVMVSKVWGVSSKDPIDTRAQIELKMIECAEQGIKPSMSAAGTALGQYMRFYDGRDGRPKTSQLPPRWRSLAHAAFHGGPISITKAHGRDVVHIDLNAAYLKAMRRPIPIFGKDPENNQRTIGGWRTWKGAKWSEIDALCGFVEATVTVDPEKFGEGDVPPLPVRHFGGSVHPVGTIRGAWPIGLVKDAVDAGEVVVHEVHQFMFAPETASIFDEVATDFSSTPQGKILYTRFWGKWAANGGFTGSRSEEPPDGSVHAYGLWWESNAIDALSVEAPPTYRPDIAATIAGYNHQQVFQAIRRLKKGSILCVYVDEIWTTDIEGAEKFAVESREEGLWRRKIQGDLRLYGPGVYRHTSSNPEVKSKVAAAGYSSELHGPLTPGSLEAWATSPQHRASRFTLNSRAWTAPPNLDPTATSRPVLMRASEARRAHDGPDVHHDCWTSRGWLRNEYASKLGRKA
jgi:hypothetical protein